MSICQTKGSDPAAGFIVNRPIFYVKFLFYLEKFVNGEETIIGWFCLDYRNVLKVIWITLYFFNLSDMSIKREGHDGH